MLTNEQIIENKEKFLKLVAEINIEGADTQGLVEYLDKTDFFVASLLNFHYLCIV